MIRAFLMDGVLNTLLAEDFGEKPCMRNDYVIDDVNLPVSFEITSGNSSYTVESWLRDDSAAKMANYGKKNEVSYDITISNDDINEGPAGMQRLFTGVARQLDRFLDKISFMDSNTVPDPEEGGVLVSVNRDGLDATVVKGSERPDLKCFMTMGLIQGKQDIQVARPYKDEIMDSLMSRFKKKDSSPKDEKKSVEEYVDRNADFQTEGNVLIRYAGKERDVVIPKGIKEIGNGSALTFFQTNVVSVEIPPSVTTIGGYAFYNCGTLTKVVIPKSVKTIGHHAFRECSSLKAVSIPDDITIIERECFWGCTGLKTIKLPKALKIIEEKAFSGCVSVINIIIPEGAEVIEDGAFWGDECLETVTIPSTVTKIGEMAFSDCNKLTICAPAGSNAERYAKENGIPFRAIHNEGLNGFSGKVDAEEYAEKKAAEDHLKTIEKEYNQAVDAWNKECDRIFSKRNAELKARVKQEEEKYKKEAQDAFTAAIDTADEKIAQQKAIQQAAQEKLSTLGLFKFSEKAEQNAIIAKAKAEIQKAEAERSKAWPAHNMKIAEMDENLQQIKDALEDEIDDLYPLPEKPKKPVELVKKEKAEKEKREAERAKREAERAKRRRDAYEDENTKLINKVAYYLAKSPNDNIGAAEFRNACIACNVDPDSFTDSDFRQLQRKLNEIT